MCHSQLDYFNIVPPLPSCKQQFPSRLTLGRFFKLRQLGCEETYFNKEMKRLILSTHKLTRTFTEYIAMQWAKYVSILSVN